MIWSFNMGTFVANANITHDRDKDLKNIQDYSNEKIDMKSEVVSSYIREIRRLAKEKGVENLYLTLLISDPEFEEAGKKWLELFEKGATEEDGVDYLHRRNVYFNNKAQENKYRRLFKELSKKPNAPAKTVHNTPNNEALKDLLAKFNELSAKLEKLEKAGKGK